MTRRDVARWFSKEQVGNLDRECLPPKMHKQDVKRFNNKSMPATTGTLQLDDIKRLFGMCPPYDREFTWHRPTRFTRS